MTISRTLRFKQTSMSNHRNKDIYLLRMDKIFLHSSENETKYLKFFLETRKVFEIGVGTWNNAKLVELKKMRL